VRSGPGATLRVASPVRRIVGMEMVSGLGDGIFWVGLAAVLIDRGAGAAGFALAVRSPASGLAPS
jgi:hypothetical protein